MYKALFAQASENAGAWIRVVGIEAGEKWNKNFPSASVETSSYYKVVVIRVPLQGQNATIDKVLWIGLNLLVS